MQFSEIELVSEIGKRNTEAFEALIQEYTKPVYHLTYNILGIGNCKEDIEECVSDVFLEAWQKIKRYDPEKGGFRTWVLMLAKYKALAYKRRMERHPMELLEDEGLMASDNVEGQVIDRETQRQVLAAINTFGEVDRQLFIRRYLYDEPIPALMESMQLSRSAIDNRLLRGRNKIREAISYGG